MRITWPMPVIRLEQRKLPRSILPKYYAFPQLNIQDQNDLYTRFRRDALIFVTTLNFQ
jgi:hypothetical protein